MLYCSIVSIFMNLDILKVARRFIIMTQTRTKDHSLRFLLLKLSSSYIIQTWRTWTRGNLV